jgi:hypothetical protein
MRVTETSNLEKTKMTPIGPYRNEWSDKAHYIIQIPGSFAIVVDGQQPYEGMKIPSIREGEQWLKENGFQKK